MNVLSLFDGMSCGQIALNLANIPYDNYFASEIDKYAIKVTQHNYPNTIQLGDITQVKGADLPKIDLLIGGSPCQGFSNAGKGLNFDDPRSKLFFEYVRLLKETKPKYWLLENVKMKKEWVDVISGILGTKPVEINSALVSGQNRVRLYWTNIPVKEPPPDKGVLLRDVLESGVTDRYKSYNLDANYFKGGNLDSYFRKGRRQLVFEPSSEIPLYILPHGYIKESFKLTAKYPTFVGQDPSTKYLLNYEGQWRKLTPTECERLQTVPEGYTSCASNTQRYKMLGNGWTVDVIVHILKQIPEYNIDQTINDKTTVNYYQLELF